MEELQQEYLSLQNEFTRLEEDFGQHKRITTRALKMLAGTLEIERSDSENPSAALSAGMSLPEIQSVVERLEREFRRFTMDRERHCSHLHQVLSGWLRQLDRQLEGADKTELFRLDAGLRESCNNFSSLVPMITSLVGMQRLLLTQPDAQVIQPVAALPAAALITLKRLLELLPLDDRGREHALEISAAIGEQMPVADLLEQLDTVVQLLESRDNHKDEEVADFLKALASRLLALQNELQASRDDNAEFDSREERHTEQMSRGLEDIQAGMSKATTFEELKAVVATQLEHVTDSFAEFKQSRQQRHERLQARYDELVRHLAEVEAEARVVKSVVDLEQQRAMTDHLTELPNRRAYERHLNSEFHRWTRYQTPFSIIVVDIDYFKTINDRFGHLVGDRALKLVAKVLARQLRESDMIARYGGEEFVVLLANTELEAARATAEKLRRAIEQAPFKYGHDLVDIRVSVGVTNAQEKDTISSLFERADKALYRAKEAGRNRVEVG